MLYVDLEGAVVADTLHPEPRPRAFEIPELIEQARKFGTAAGIHMLEGGVYQLLTVPVRAPLPIGFVVIGFAINDSFAADLRQLATADVSFLADTGTRWRVIASTLATSSQQEMARQLPLFPVPTSLDRLRLQGRRLPAARGAAARGRQPAHRGRAAALAGGSAVRVRPPAQHPHRARHREPRGVDRGLPVDSRSTSRAPSPSSCPRRCASAAATTARRWACTARTRSARSPTASTTCAAASRCASRRSCASRTRTS